MNNFFQNFIIFLMIFIVFLLPATSLSRYFSIHPIFFILLIIIIFEIVNIFLRGKILIPKADEFYFLLLLFVLFFSLSLIFAPKPPYFSFFYPRDFSIPAIQSARLFSFFSILKAICFLLVIFIVVSSRDFFVKILKAHIITSVAVSLFGIINFLMKIFGFFYLKFTLMEGWIVPRLRSLSFEPQDFGSYLLTTIPLLLIGYFSKEKFLFKKRTIIFFIIINLTALILTFSTGGYITAILMMVVFFLFSPFFGINTLIDRKRKYFLFSLGIFCVFIFSIISFRYLIPVFSKILKFSNSDSSFSERLLYWSAALKMIKYYPLFGVGPGSFPYFYPNYGKQIPNKSIIFNDILPQNLFLGMVAEIGIIGGGILLLIFFYLFLKLLKIGKKRNNDYFTRISSFSLFLVLFNIFLQNMAFWAPYSFFLWFFIAICGVFVFRISKLKI